MNVIVHNHMILVVIWHVLAQFHVSLFMHDPVPEVNFCQPPCITLPSLTWYNWGSQQKREASCHTCCLCFWYLSHQCYHQAALVLTGAKLTHRCLTVMKYLNALIWNLWYVIDPTKQTYTVEPCNFKPIKCRHLVLTDFFAQVQIAYLLTVHYNYNPECRHLTIP